MKLAGFVSLIVTAVRRLSWSGAVGFIFVSVT